MKLMKTFPICHCGSAIFSVDIQPGDRRLATGGRAESGAGVVVIWDFKTLVEAAKKGQSQLKLLSRFENHVGCVNCVRWSGSGRYLASAGDDSLITIMQYAGRLAAATENGLSFGQAGKAHQNVELWKCVHTLRGHAGDVLHVAWSPGDLYLASCSIDNQIIIWNGHRFGEKVASLSGHEGLVKGITWDPIGKYLASQSDDKTLRIWLTSNWTQTKVLHKPFRECSPTTQFLRLDWSPDGSIITSAHAMNNGGPASVLLERAGWESQRDLIGHRKAITCTRWSPCLYETNVAGSAKPVQLCVCAVGSKDRSISIWSTESQRPLAVVHDAFTHSVMDLSWSHCGTSLVACSSDGAISVLSFSGNELGQVLSSSDKAEVLSRLYGKYDMTPTVNGYANGHDWTLSNCGKPCVIDNPEIIRIQQNLRRLEEETAAAGKTARAGVAAKNDAPGEKQLPSRVDKQQNGDQRKQVEERTKDGRRRIKPIFLGSTVVSDPNDEVPVPAGNELTSTIVNESAQPAIADATPSQEVSLPEGVSVNARPSDHSKNEVQAPAGNELSLISKTLNDSTTMIKGTQIKRKQDSSQSLVGQPPKKQKQQSQLQQKRSRRAVLSDDEDDVSVVASEPEQNRSKEAAKTEPQTSNSSSCAPAISLPVPAKANQLSVAVFTGTARGKVQTKITCQNGVTLASSNVPASKLTSTQGDVVVWQTLIGDEILALAASAYLVAVASSNRRLTFLTTSGGSRLMPPIALDSDISILSIQDYFAMAVTKEGLVYVWRLEGEFICLCKESLLPIANAANVALISGFITNYGAPVLTLADGKSYVYNTTMRSWLVLFDPQDALTAASLDSKRSVMTNSCKLDGPLASCLRSGVGSSSVRLPPNGREKRGFTMAVVAFLESQMKSALELRSKQEYHFWLMQYVQHLTREGLTLPLRLLCNDLMDSVFEGTTVRTNEEENILGISKQSLLQEILPIIATNGNLQRLYGELKDHMSAYQANGHDEPESML